MCLAILGFEQEIHRHSIVLPFTLSARHVHVDVDVDVCSNAVNTSSVQEFVLTT